MEVTGKTTHEYELKPNSLEYGETEHTALTQWFDTKLKQKLDSTLLDTEKVDLTVSSFFQLATSTTTKGILQEQHDAAVAAAQAELDSADPLNLSQVEAAQTKLDEVKAAPLPFTTQLTPSGSLEAGVILGKQGSKFSLPIKFKVSFAPGKDPQYGFSLVPTIKPLGSSKSGEKGKPLKFNFSSVANEKDWTTALTANGYLGSKFKLQGMEPDKPASVSVIFPSPFADDLLRLTSLKANAELLREVSETQNFDVGLGASRTMVGNRGEDKWSVDNSVRLAFYHAENVQRRIYPDSFKSVSAEASWGESHSVTEVTPSDAKDYNKLLSDEEQVTLTGSLEMGIPTRTQPRGVDAYGNAAKFKKRDEDLSFTGLSYNPLGFELVLEGSKVMASSKGLDSDGNSVTLGSNPSGTSYVWGAYLMLKGDLTLETLMIWRYKNTQL